MIVYIQYLLSNYNNGIVVKILKENVQTLKTWSFKHSSLAKWSYYLNTTKKGWHFLRALFFFNNLTLICCDLFLACNEEVTRPSYCDFIFIWFFHYWFLQLYFKTKNNFFNRFLDSFYKNRLKRTDKARKMNSFKKYGAPCTSTFTKNYWVFLAPPRAYFYCQKPKNF